MKNYSVLCFGSPGNPMTITSVEVSAENPEDAKTLAVELMKRMGHPDAIVAPDLGNPSAPVVMELKPTPPMKLYRVLCFLTRTEGESLSRVKVRAPDEASARQVALNLLRKEGYPRAWIPMDVGGFKMVEEITE